MALIRQMPVKIVTITTSVVIVSFIFFEIFAIYFPLPDLLINLNVWEKDPLFLASTLIIAPINKEIIFRGIITKELMNYHPERLTIIFSGLSYGIIHLNPAQIIPATFSGFFLSWLYIRTENLKICIFLHIINNSLTII